MRHRRRSLHNVVAVVIAAVAFSGTALAATDACVTAIVPGPIVLPDGTSHPAGSICLCLTERLSPVAGLHETIVDGLPVGMFLSRYGPIEASPADHAEPTLHFVRTVDGAWILEAYAINVGRRVILYKLRDDLVPERRLDKIRRPHGEAVVLAAASSR